MSLRLRLRLDNLEIENRFLTHVHYTHDGHIQFSGRAIEMEGKRICSALSKFKKGQVVEIEDRTRYDGYEGICKIVEIETLLPNVDEHPPIFRFSGKLKMVF